MYVIREAIPDDAPTLLKLAKMLHSNNLPADLDIIRASIDRSIESFAGQYDDPAECHFMFVLEDMETGNMIGTSCIVGRVGLPHKPHLYLQVRKREHYSNDLQAGTVHVTVELCQETNGMTEIGGLVLGPSYRGHKAKLGLLLSMIRFQFMAMNRKYFSDRLIAEMMGRLTPDSRNTLWEYLGRRFINLEYAEADRFCRHSKEFITSLFPKGEVYTSLLPAEARNLIGKVSPEAEGAKSMLESLGFKYKEHVDPFDGGPYLEAKLDDIQMIQTTKRAKLVSVTDHIATSGVEGFVSFVGETGYRAIRAFYSEVDGGVAIAKDEAELLAAQVGDELVVTPRPMSSAKGASETARVLRVAKADKRKRVGLRKAAS
ncbi:MAG TPA: arginine N-succinyltransferase [Phycisphaerales bacterium]|nr:arginine N-succinyltransferase [Phycisphaerales bacterium]